jgi:amidohydrolase
MRLLALALFTALAAAQSSTPADVQAVVPDAHALYLDLHQHPELSSHETQTAAELADRLRKLGYEVTANVGGTGVVAILKNGPGPTVMLRTELDALPVEEHTGLPFASKVHAKDDAGHDVPVMHACGHDLHMASWWGTAAVMAKTKANWHGTLMLIGQPAEETITGAQRMIADGLFTRFPRPDVGIALHDSNSVPAGKVAVTPKIFNTAADSLRITIYGRGGHGSRPDITIDPVVLAANIVVRLQSIVAREVRPGEIAVITVGSIQAGTKNNIIPDTAQLALTVRSRKNEVREHVLAAIDRVVKGEAIAAGVEKMPLVEKYESTSAVYNDPVLADQLIPVLESALGKNNVILQEPIMASEDYAAFIEGGVPSLYFELGAADPAKLAASQTSGVPLPNLHSSQFAPVVDTALPTAITAEVALLQHLLQGKPFDRNTMTEHKTSQP